MTNHTNQRIVVEFTNGQVYFLNPNEALPASWQHLELKQISAA